MRTIPLQLNHLRAVSLFVAKQDIRYYLNGVLVEVTPTAVRLCATNGRAMAVTNTPHAEGEPAPICGQWIIPTDAIKDGIKCAGKHLSVVMLSVPEDGTSNNCTLGLPWNAVMFNAIDGRFPDYRRVVPVACSGELAQYDPEYLFLFKQAALVYRGKHAKGAINICHNGKESARIGGIDDEFIGVIMPWLVGDAPALPDWWINSAPALAVAT